jgi:pimeloyl-ACP methyl ester carboxylesterase
MERLFLPGWGAPGSLYTPGLAPGWTALEPPSFAVTRGSLGSYRSWLLSELERRTVPSCLAGHSMGGALAVLAAAAAPELVSRLVLISPAGLPLSKPMTASLARFASQAATGCYASTEMVAAVGRVARAPRAALRLARAVRALDLEQEMRAVRASGVPVEVVGCATDTLVTPANCRSVARLLGGSYRELTCSGGHMWMLDAWPTLAGILGPAEPAAAGV